MRVATAMLPDAASSQDRVFVTETAVIVLDGASAFVPVEVSPSTYVDVLGQHLVEGLNAGPQTPLTDVLAQAIETTASNLDLFPGSSPSSTVAIARQDGDALDLLVLGDTQIATPKGIHVDNRIAQFAQKQRARYRARLAAGHGYDEAHRELLGALQTEQAQHRNVEGGFWIAEADPAAAHHAQTVREDLESMPWLVLATDGAYRPMRHLRLDDWPVIAADGPEGLRRLLNTLSRWEAETDPAGLALPRAKRHDDKSVAVVHGSGMAKNERRFRGEK